MAGPPTPPAEAAALLTWWQDAGPAAWFRKDPAFDATFRERFGALHEAAARRQLDGWRATPDGMLALILLLDQFPRNVFRDTAHAYATDPLARRFAREALAAGHFERVPPGLRVFLSLPFSHSEDTADQTLAMSLAARLDDEASRRAAREHQDIVQRFGRFPHRNPALGRDTTPDEQAFLDGGGFRG